MKPPLKLYSTLTDKQLIVYLIIMVALSLILPVYTVWILV